MRDEDREDAKAGGYERCKTRCKVWCYQACGVFTKYLCLERSPDTPTPFLARMTGYWASGGSTVVCKTHIIIWHLNMLVVHKVPSARYPRNEWEHSEVLSTTRCPRLRSSTVPISAEKIK